jgi:LPS sulfotransferase NodH
MKTKISYIVCAVQRSGSSLLCEALKNTGLAGVPEEYFLYHENLGNWEQGEWASSFGVTSREAYIDLVLQQGSTENGVFGTKLMWNYFSHVVKAFGEIPAYHKLSPSALFAAMLENPKYIWIVRKDKVRQAVSWAIAAQTNIYASSHGNIEDYLYKLKFDYEQINLLHHLVLEGEAGWYNYFQSNGIQPFKVIYEELVENYEKTGLDILEFLGIERPEKLYFSKRGLKKQATQINDEWVEKYLTSNPSD